MKVIHPSSSNMACGPTQNSIDIYRQLNRDRFPVRELQPGATMLVIDIQNPNLFTISVHSDIKEKIAQKESSFRQSRQKLPAWAQQIPNNEVVVQTQTIYEQISGNIQQLKLTGYALDRSFLNSTDEMLQVVNDITEDFVANGRPPTENESKFLHSTEEFTDSLYLAASDTDGNLIKTSIKTITGTPQNEMIKEEISGLSVCYENASKLYLFKQKYPNQKPDWPCTNSFVELSSPARHEFKRHLMYVILGV